MCGEFEVCIFMIFVFGCMIMFIVVVYFLGMFIMDKLGICFQVILMFVMVVVSIVLLFVLMFVLGIVGFLLGVVFVLVVCQVILYVIYIYWYWECLLVFECLEDFVVVVEQGQLGYFCLCC